MNPPDHKPAIRAINRAIQAEDAALRAAHPWLRHQDALGLGVFIAAWAVALAAGAAWLGGLAPWWITVPAVAVAISFLHELEHDLIHDLYFSGRAWVQNALFAGIFLAKMSMDPWTRRRIHLRHHRVSGQPIDIEERLIGLGLPLGPKRLLLTLLPAFSGLVWPSLVADLRAHRADHPRKRRRPTEPLWMHPVRLLSGGFALLPFVVIPAAVLGHAWAQATLVLYVAPNLLRHAAIAFTSSSSHYYGDIAPNDVFMQNQVLDHWLFWPLQLFCFNFGATHVLHHYVVRQPFYLRQWVAPRVLPVLLDHGVRHNDMRAVVSANRWGRPAS